MALPKKHIGNLVAVNHVEFGVYQGEIFGFLRPDGCQRSQPHEHLSITRDDDYAPVRLGDCKSEADHGGTAHRPPQGKIQRMIASSCTVPNRLAGQEMRKSLMLRGLQESGIRSFCGFPHKAAKYH